MPEDVDKEEHKEEYEQRVGQQYQNKRTGGIGANNVKRQHRYANTTNTNERSFNIVDELRGNNQIPVVAAAKGRHRVNDVYVN